VRTSSQPQSQVSVNAMVIKRLGAFIVTRAVPESIMPSRSIQGVGHGPVFGGKPMTRRR
jgi:hypothetical protein